MAVELQVAIESQFGVSIPAMAINEETSIGLLAGQVAKQLGGNGAAGDTGGAAELESERDLLFASLNARHAEGLSSEELKELADDVVESERLIQ